MREPITLVRITHPTLEPLEADLVSIDDAVSIYIPSSYADSIPSFNVDERIILTWYDNNKHSKAKIISITQEDISEELLTKVKDEQKLTDSNRWYMIVLSVSLEPTIDNLRHYPRLLGGINLSYVPVTDGNLTEAWLDGQEDEQIENFHQPIDSLMNFSVNGLKFECKAELTESTLLLCTVGLLSEEKQWRTLAKVVRVWKEESYNSVAIHFISPPVDLTTKLSEFTLKLQRTGEFSS